MAEEPIRIALPPEKITPSEYGIYCQIMDGSPFVNTICNRRWSDDGEQVWFMLDSCNFECVPASGTLEVVQLGKSPTPCLGTPYCRCDACFVASRPSPLSAEDADLIARLRQLPKKDRERLVRLANGETPND